MFSYLSYRDPNLMKTVDVYDGTPQFLRELELDQVRPRPLTNPLDYIPPCRGVLQPANLAIELILRGSMSSLTNYYFLNRVYDIIEQQCRISVCCTD
jgi:Zn-dependent M16 (insulinase) family peptidase